jgi:hypothetical protein
MPALPSFLVLTFFITSGLCAVYQQLGDLKQLQFDFVVVGGQYETWEIYPIQLMSLLSLKAERLEQSLLVGCLK